MSDFEKGRAAAKADKVELGVETVLDICNELVGQKLNMFIMGYRVGAKQFDQTV